MPLSLYALAVATFAIGTLASASGFHIAAFNLGISSESFNRSLPLKGAGLLANSLRIDCDGALAAINCEASPNQEGRGCETQRTARII